MSLDARTVRRWLDEPQFRARVSAARPSKLDPYKDYIRRLLEHHRYSAVQIRQRLREAGYDGGLTIVKDYVRQVRPVRAPAFLTLHFAPGECAQVDWGHYGSVRVGNTRRRLSFFVMVLCYSRMMYVEFTVSQTLEHFLGCHRNAFEFFDARVPARVMIDNLRSAVLQRAVGQAPVFHPRYADFARHHRFEIAPCNVGAGHEKGRVEASVGYVKKNFLAGFDIPDFQALNPACRRWLDTVANVRIHGETRRRPVELFDEERDRLRRLPELVHDIGSVHTVRASNRFRVTFETNRYSVPAEYASARLLLKSYPDRLCIYHRDRLVARHRRSYERHRLPVRQVVDARPLPGGCRRHGVPASGSAGCGPRGAGGPPGRAGTGARARGGCDPGPVRTVLMSEFTRMGVSSPCTSTRTFSGGPTHRGRCGSGSSAPASSARCS